MEEARRAMKLIGPVPSSPESPLVKELE